MCRDLDLYALTRSDTLGSQTNALLLRTGKAIAVFRRGTRAAAVKGGGRLAKLGAVKTDADWTLWASHGAAGSVEAQAAQRDTEASTSALTGLLRSTYRAPPLARRP